MESVNSLNTYVCVVHTDPKRIENAGAIVHIPPESDQSWQAKALDAL